jgi:hypothetical protein
VGCRLPGIGGGETALAVVKLGVSVEDIGGSGGIHFRFFAKKKRRFILCFRDFSRLLAGFRSRFSVGFSERFLRPLVSLSSCLGLQLDNLST